MDLLELAAGGGRGRWCATVAKECTRSSSYPGLQELSRAHAIFGTPLYPETGAERLEVQHLRVELASPGDKPTAHLGEAETLAIIGSRPVLAGVFVTDDGAAIRLANSHKVRVVTTWDLIRTLVRAGRVTEDDAAAFGATLRAEKRRMPPGVGTDDELRRWLRNR